MELVSCQSCGHRMDAASKFCNECGQRRDVPVLTRQTLTGDPPVYDRRSETRARCPGCGGEQFRKLSLIHDGGVSHTSSATKGVGVTLGGGIGIGSAKSRGMNVTELARKAAPPEKISLLKAVGAGLFFGFFVAAMLPQGWEILALLAFLALPIGAGYWVVKYNRETWAPAYAAWQKRFMCDRCGEVFAL
jgi:hypothetical protein